MTKLLSQVKKSRNIEPFFTLKIKRNFDKKTKTILQIDPPDFRIKNFYLNKNMSEVINSYKEYIKNNVIFLLNDAKINYSINEIMINIDEIVEFEKKIDEIIEKNKFNFFNTLIYFPTLKAYSFVRIEYTKKFYYLIKYNLD